MNAISSSLQPVYRRSILAMLANHYADAYAVSIGVFEIWLTNPKRQWPKVAISTLSDERIFATVYNDAAAEYKRVTLDLADPDSLDILDSFLAGAIAC